MGPNGQAQLAAPYPSRPNMTTQRFRAKAKFIPSLNAPKLMRWKNITYQIYPRLLSKPWTDGPWGGTLIRLVDKKETNNTTKKGE